MIRNVLRPLLASRPRRMWLGERIVAQYEDDKVREEIRQAAERRPGETSHEGEAVSGMTETSTAEATSRVA